MMTEASPVKRTRKGGGTKRAAERLFNEKGGRTFPLTGKKLVLICHSSSSKLTAVFSRAFGFLLVRLAGIGEAATITCRLVLDRGGFHALLGPTREHRPGIAPGDGRVRQDHKRRWRRARCRSVDTSMAVLVGRSFRCKGHTDRRTAAVAAPGEAAVGTIIGMLGGIER
jgi:hypothetical protein